MVLRQGHTRWEEIFETTEKGVSEPLPFLVNEVHRLKIGGRALDLGCGMGRHCIYLAGRGFETFGFDISRSALRKATLRIATAKASALLTQGDMLALPYRDNSFDLVLSINVIHHTDSSGLRLSAKEIHRVLKVGGYLIATLSTTKDYKFGQGIKVEEKTFLHQAGVEAGILHHFMDEKDIRDYFSSFRVESLCEERGSFFFYECRKDENYHWFLTASKT